MFSKLQQFKRFTLSKFALKHLIIKNYKIYYFSFHKSVLKMNLYFL